MAKLKSWLKYTIYFILLMFLIYLKMYFNKKFVDKDTFQFHYYALVISFIIGIGLGLLLGLEHFIGEMKKRGRWRINLPKLILVAVPCFYFSLSYVIMASSLPLPIINTLFYPTIFIHRYFTGYEVFLQLITGYILLTSFDKYHPNI